jgi:hypothetical protein
MTGTPSPGSAGPSTTRRGRHSTRSRASWVAATRGTVRRGGGAQTAIRTGSISPSRCWTAGCDMSFSGLKTAVLRARDRLVQDQGGLTEGTVPISAPGSRLAVADVLAAKTAAWR